MKQSAMIIFITIVSSIYFVGNWYVYHRGMQAMPSGAFKTVFPYLFWTFAASFIVGQFLERGEPMLFSQTITFIGSIWLASLLYLFMAVLSIDIVRLFDQWFHFIPNHWHDDFLTGKNVFIGVSILVGSIIIGGHINAIFPRIHSSEISIDKPANGQKEIKLALVTDIHMGFIIGNNRVKRMVKQLNKLEPDLVLFGGDLVDHNPKPVIKKDMGRHFKDIKSTFGMYAITGNHEYIGSPDVSVDYLSKNGVTYVRDSMINVANKVWIIGRDDREKSRYEGGGRKNLSSIINGESKTLPTILLDHQPVEYDSVIHKNIDLMLSGHTHKGQLWPFGYITKKMFENHFGLYQRGKTWFYTSSGYGTWGPPVRVGNRPEISFITIKLN